jgi:hypothetical protein
MMPRWRLALCRHDRLVKGRAVGINGFGTASAKCSGLTIELKSLMPLARHGRRRWAILFRRSAMTERAEIYRRTLCHALEAGATTTSGALTFERACHCVRVSCDDR